MTLPVPPAWPAERFRGQVLAALWRLRENPAVLAGDQVERFVRECIRRA